MNIEGGGGGACGNRGGGRVGANWTDLTIFTSSFSLDEKDGGL